MALDLQELRDKYGRCIKAAQDIHERAAKENRSLTSEEETAYGKAMDDGLDVKKDLDRELQLRESGDYLSQLDKPLERRTGHDPLPKPVENRNAETPERAVIKCRGQEFVLEQRSLLGQASEQEYREAFRGYLATGQRPEQRALQMDSDTGGGYLVPPAFSASIIEAVDDMTYIRQWADTQTVTNADSLGRPSRDADVADHDWTVELGTGSEDSTLAFGKRELTPHPVAKRIKVSRKLMRAVPSVEGYVRGRLAYKLGVTHEKAFLTGSGAGQPLGLFTASSDGISTSRDVSTGNTSTTIEADGLKEAYYSLKVQYRTRARWMFHRDGCKQIAKLKDGNGNYLLTMSNNEPGVTTLFNQPIAESEFSPNTFTTGLYVGILGDFSQYMIVDALTMEMQRLEELYSETNQVGFIVRSETDGMPVLEEAFARVTLA